MSDDKSKELLAKELELAARELGLAAKELSARANLPEFYVQRPAPPEPAAAEPAVFGDEKAVRNQQALAAVSLNDGLVSLSIPQEEFASQIVEILRERVYLSCPPVGFKEDCKLKDLVCKDLVLVCNPKLINCTPICPELGLLRCGPYLNRPECRHAYELLEHITLQDIRLLVDKGILTERHLAKETIQAIQAIRS